MIEREVDINDVDIHLKDLAESQLMAVREPGFFLSTVDGLLPSVWGMKGWIHGKDIAKLDTKGTN